MFNLDSLRRIALGKTKRFNNHPIRKLRRFRLTKIQQNRPFVPARQCIRNL